MSTVNRRILFIICSMILFFGLLYQPTYAYNSTVNMVDMHEKESQYCEIITDNIVDSYYGKTHKSNVYKMDASNCAYVVYELDGCYSSFLGTLVASIDTGREASMNIAIFVDGNLKWDFSGFTKQNEPENISIDLNGAKTFSIKTSNSGGYSYGWVFVIDAKFSKLEQPVACNEYASLSVPYVIDKEEYDYNKTLMQDSYGFFHDGSHYLDASQNAMVLYNLNKEYSTLSYSIVTSPQTGSGASMSIKVFFNDIEQPSLFYSGITKQTGKIDFSNIDVSDVKTLKFETTNEGEYSYGWLYIVDDFLSSHRHANGDWIVKTEATCTKAGEKIQYCTDCGAVCASEPIPANGHKATDKWVETLAPTCAAYGEEVQYCLVCGDIVNTRAIDCLTHTEGGEWEILTEPTCTDMGKRVKRCVVCNKIIESEDIEMVPHNFGKWTVSNRLWGITPSEEIRTCTGCGLVETRGLDSTPTYWLIYITIIVDMIIYGAAFVLYSAKFGKFQLYNIFSYHLVLAVLIIYYGMGLPYLIFICVVPIVIYFLPSKLFANFASLLTFLGCSINSFFPMKSMPLFLLEYIYIAIMTYLKDVKSRSRRN